MTSGKMRIIYHGGTLPVPSRLQRGTIQLRGERLLLRFPENDPLYSIDLSLTLSDITRAEARERKYYSSVGYFLIIRYLDELEREQEIELEVRSFIRRGRAQAQARYWAGLLEGRAVGSGRRADRD